MSPASDDLDPSARIWVVDLTYVRPLEDVDTHRAAHLEVLDRFAQAGVVAASGAKTPRTGGVIVSNPVRRDQIDALVADDPFHRFGMARFSITGLTPRVDARFRAWAAAYAVAVQERRIDAVTGLFAEDAVYVCGAPESPLRGRDSIRAFWEGERVDVGAGATATCQVVAEGGDTAVIRTVIEFSEPDRRTDRRLSVVTLDEAGRCTAFEEYTSS